MAFVVRDHDAPLDAPLGGKARALAALRDAGVAIPPWVVVLPSALAASLGPERLGALERATTAEEMQAAFAGVVLPDAVLAELQAALGSLGGSLAVRSSASDEDGARHSFAGQLESYLGVAPADVPARVVDVWRSAYGERVLAYRREHGLGPTPRPPAVLLQTMVPAEAAGVAFGADPVSGRRSLAAVSAVRGLGAALVAGAADADTWHVDRDNRIVARHLAGASPVLSDEQVLAVAELVRLCGRHFGRPQDVEWATAGGRLHLLQSRPITTLAGRPDPEGAYNLWDNSNIAESYNGVTTPLTFSFARRVYEEVYKQFCRLLRVPESVIEASGDVFRRMLGLVRGTVYYNLLNWYRLIALLPGYKANRGFMEQMMGVKEALPEDAVPPTTAPTWTERLWDRLRLWRSSLALLGHHWTLGGQIRRFYRRLDDALGTTRPDLGRMSPHEIVAHLRGIESKLLKRWDAPLLNDFLAMIFFGVLGKLTRAWCGDEEGTLRNDLLCGEGGMISAEPARRIREMARAVAPHPRLVDALCDGGWRDIEPEATPEFRQLYDDYLDRFGDRCLEELKLESNTLFDDPTTLWRAVGRLARRGVDEPTGIEREVRARAEQRVRKALGWRPFRRLVFWWVLANARARVRDRENLRFERTRVFGRVRRVFVELGRHLYAVDRLDDPRDVFYLEMNEVLDFVEGTATTTDLRGLAAVRKAEFARWRTTPRPAGRFETRGLVYLGHAYEPTTPPAPLAPGEERTGLGCCPGVVRGPVRVVTDPRGAHLHAGEILVAERTDPGWILLFPAAAGLLVERGSLLSHSAIVARELGIPAIVSLPDATRWLRTGDEVEMDGATGRVRRLARPGGGP